MEGYEDLVPKKSSTGDSYADLVPKKTEPKAQPRLPSMFTTAPQPEAEAAGSLAAMRGLTSEVLGTPGALESVVTPKAKGQLKGQETVFPTPENIRTGLSKFGWKEPEKKELQAAQFAGEVAPMIAAGGSLVETLGKGVIKSGKELAASLKRPPPIAAAEGLDVVGEKGFDLVKKKAEKLYEARKTEAEEKYSNAYDAARKAQALGQPFATSPQGMSLLQSLEKEKSILAGGKKFARGEEKIAGINRLINAVKGTKTGGERVAKEIPRVGQTPGKIFKTTPAKTTEKDIEAIVEELRFLRDVDAKGKSYEAYASLDANYKRDLISKLESALYDWNKDYRLADEAYKAASKKLEPFKTQLMSNALKGEKFNPKDLVASPEEFGPKFFSDVDGVRQLKEVTQDAAAVNQLGKEYVASLLSNKTPQQIQAFVKDPKNIGWLRESGILEDVTKYANQAEKAASRSEILSNLKKGAIYGIGAATIGGPAFYGARRALGI